MAFVFASPGLTGCASRSAQSALPTQLQPASQGVADLKKAAARVALSAVPAIGSAVWGPIGVVIPSSLLAELVHSKTSPQQARKTASSSGSTSETKTILIAVKGTPVKSTSAAVRKLADIGDGYCYWTAWVIETTDYDANENISKITYNITDVQISSCDSGYTEMRPWDRDSNGFGGDVSSGGSNDQSAPGLAAIRR